MKNGVVPTRTRRLTVRPILLLSGRRADTTVSDRPTPSPRPAEEGTTRADPLCPQRWQRKRQDQSALLYPLRAGVRMSAAEEDVSVAQALRKGL
jgi:hypothetical protein